jgi:threonine dehydrogenase-like Zn-dependent dehydrogenase
MQGAAPYGRTTCVSSPKIIQPTDAIIRISAACVCGSDLWPYRGSQLIEQPTPVGHEYCGIVEEVFAALQKSPVEFHNEPDGH